MSDTKSSQKVSKTASVIVASLAFLILLGLAGYLILSGKDEKLSESKQRGSEFLLKEDYESAKEEFKKAIELEADNLVLYFQIAEAYIGLDHYSDAATYLEKAIKIAEDEPKLDTERYVSLIIKLAECYTEAGQDQKRSELLKNSYKVTESERIGELLQEE